MQFNREAANHAAGAGMLSPNPKQLNQARSNYNQHRNSTKQGFGHQESQDSGGGGSKLGGSNAKSTKNSGEK